MSERDRIDELLVRASKLGVRLFRNNSGVAFHKDGKVTRYGVAPGGSDLLGWKMFHVKQSHVGLSLALFTAVEVKDEKHKPTPEQQRFLDAVNGAGGLAIWGHDVDDLLRKLT